MQLLDKRSNASVPCGRVEVAGARMLGGVVLVSTAARAQASNKLSSPRKVCFSARSPGRLAAGQLRRRRGPSSRRPYAKAPITGSPA
jgi:hypothetical protein